MYPPPQCFFFFLYCFNTLHICTHVMWTLQQWGEILIHFFCAHRKVEFIWFIMRRKMGNERIVSKLTLKRKLTISCNVPFFPLTSQILITYQFFKEHVPPHPWLFPLFHSNENSFQRLQLFRSMCLIKFLIFLQRKWNYNNSIALIK